MSVVTEYRAHLRRIAANHLIGVELIGPVEPKEGE